MRNFFFLALLLFFTNCTLKQKEVERETALKDDIQEPKKKSVFDLMIGKWISTKEYVNGKVDTTAGMFEIVFKTDSTFKSSYGPDNFKKGNWKLVNDSTFFFYLKAREEFRILEVSDSTMTLELIWSNDKRIIDFRKVE